MKHILVTGAAGAIGGAIAAAFRKQDPRARFSLVDVNDEATAREARRVGGDAAPYNWDLSKVDALPALYAALEDERGPVDVLVNCAGIMEVRSLVATPWELGAKLMRIDLESPLRLMSLAAPGMVRRGHGTIVNVTSMAGVTPLRGCTFYGAAKAGLAMASEIARLELGPSGVHVLTVYPGPVRSGLEERARGQLPPTLISRMLPTGAPEPLAARVVEACAERRARVVYPPLYDLAARFPTVASKVTMTFSPRPRDL